MIAALVLLSALAADGTRAAKDFTEANELALKGETKSAIALYEGLLSQGVAHEDLYLNLGNAYAESGRQIDAIIAYERGLRLAPGDDDLKANLAFLRARLDKKTEPTAAQGGGAVVLADAIEPVVSRTPLEVFAWIAIAANALLFAALIFRKRWPAIGAGAVLALSLAVVGGHFVLARDPRAVVIEATDVKEGPHEKFKASARVPPGVRVRVLDEDAGFAKILRPDGTSGWVSLKSIVRV